MSLTMNSLRIRGWLTAGLAALLLAACNKGIDSGPNAGAAFPDGRMYGKYKLHSTKYDNVSRKTAKDNAADVLTQLQDEPHLCLAGLWAYNPPAILEAVKQAKKEGVVHIVAFDEDENTLLGIKDGHIFATVVQQPFEFGNQSVHLMAELAKDPNASVPALMEKQAKDLKMSLTDDQKKKGIFNVPHRVINKENVEQFQEELRKYKATAAAPGEGAGDKIKVGFVSNNAEEFWSIAEAGTRKAAQDLGVEVLFRRPKPATAAAQKEIIEDLIAQGVKAIAISVIDPVNQADYLNQIADKVPLITQDNDAEQTRRKCYIGTDNLAAGEEVGRLIKKVMPEGGTIAIFVGQPDPRNAQERRQGLLQELNKGP
jgi:ribose transport system substrate-binding protein